MLKIYAKPIGGIRMSNQETYSDIISGILEGVPQDNLPLEAKVSKNFLERYVGTKLDYNKVISENETLTKSYDFIVKSYGFNSFYDLFIYADNCDNLEQLMKGGKKDLSKLKPVTRTVMRNGKPMKTTIYEDTSSESSEENPLDSKETQSEKPQPRHARDLRMTILSTEEGVDPKTLRQLAKYSKGLSGSFDTDCSSYMILQDDSNGIGGIAGFKQEGKYLKLAFLQQDDLTSGVGIQAFYQLLKLAWKKGLGAMAPSVTSPSATALFKEYGLKKHGDCYKISAGSLVQCLGNP